MEHKLHTDRLAVMFPGLGYGPDRPLLYYAGKLARTAGYELITVSYGELPRVERPVPGKPLDTERLEECFCLALERAAHQLAAVPGAVRLPWAVRSSLNGMDSDRADSDGTAGVGAGADGPDILLISKSIGTAVGAAWAASCGLSPRQLLYTPVSRTFDFPLARSIAFHGTADPWIASGECTAGCRAAGVPLHTFEGANHSLECADVQESIRNLALAMRLTGEFIAGRAEAAVP